jgi:type I restriction enzyme, R subunit
MYTEGLLVEQPAINLFSEIGWKSLDCYSETFGEASLLGRENRSEVILVRELRKCTANEINPAIDEINRDRLAMSAIVANEACYKLLREGAKVAGGSGK